MTEHTVELLVVNLSAQTSNENGDSCIGIYTTERRAHEAGRKKLHRLDAIPTADTDPRPEYTFERITVPETDVYDDGREGMSLIHNGRKYLIDEGIEFKL